MRRKPTDQLTVLKDRRKRLKVRAAAIRTELAELETAIAEIDAAIQHEADSIAATTATRHVDLSVRVMSLVEQNIEPAVIAATLRLPRERIDEIIEEARSAIRRRRWRYPEHD